MHAIPGGAVRAASRTIVITLAAGLLLSSCATLALRAFDSSGHGSVYAEWVPHRNAGEWWYVTGVLHGKGNRLWLYQFTIFHQAKLVGQGYLLDLALTDYSSGQHIFEEYATTDSKKAYGQRNSVVFEDSSITLTRSSIEVVARGEKLSFTLSLVPLEPPVWQGDDGVEAMGLPSSAKQMSYYYSFTRLRTAGRISYVDEAGNRVVRDVEGLSWLDRQWGHFSESGWDWFSIRLFDGTDIMLYAFPQTGFRQGTIVGPRGRATRITSYSYRTEKWQVRGESRYGLRWTIDLPSFAKRYRIVALSRDDFNPNRVIGYWEGLCRVYDSNGKLVGYAVEETTASAHPLDAKSAE